jgi:hypothetical protein
VAQSQVADVPDNVVSNPVKHNGVEIGELVTNGDFSNLAPENRKPENWESTSNPHIPSGTEWICGAGNNMVIMSDRENQQSVSQRINLKTVLSQKGLNEDEVNKIIERIHKRELVFRIKFNACLTTNDGDFAKMSITYFDGSTRHGALIPNLNEKSLKLSSSNSRTYCDTAESKRFYPIDKVENLKINLSANTNGYIGFDNISLTLEEIRPSDFPLASAAPPLSR